MLTNPHNSPCYEHLYTRFTPKERQLPNLNSTISTELATYFYRAEYPGLDQWGRVRRLAELRVTTAFLTILYATRDSYEMATQQYLLGLIETWLADAKAKLTTKGDSAEEVSE